MPNYNPLAIGQAPLDATRPYDHEPISRLPAYLRETRASLFNTDINNVVFESNVATGNAVFLDSSSNIWRRSLASPDPEFADRYRFHGIAHVGTTQQSVRVFGFISYPFWIFPTDHPIYVSSTEVGILTHTSPTNTKPLMAGYAVHIDALLIDSSLAYWEQLRDEIWAARGGAPGLSAEFPYLVDRLDSELQRLIDVEVEISNARGEFVSLQARFDHITGRLVLTETELQTARGSFDSLGLRLDDSDADRVNLWNQVGILTVAVDDLDAKIDFNTTELNERIDQEVLWLNQRITQETNLINTRVDSEVVDLNSRIDTEVSDMTIYVDGQVAIVQGYAETCCGELTGEIDRLDGEIIRLDEELADRWTINETITYVTTFNEDLMNFMMAVIDGTITPLNDLWETDGEGDLMHLVIIDPFFIVNNDLNLFQGSYDQGIAPRADELDLSAVVDPFYELDGTDIMPKV